MAARIQRLGSKRRAVFVGVMLTAAAVLGAGYAYGTITATNNQYTGCLLSGNIGNLAVGSTPTKTCQNPAVQITWSQSGPQGPPGITGAPGAKGETGATGPPGSSPAAGSSCPTGAFVVGFDATGAIVCSSGSSSGGSTDTDGDGRPDSLDPCPSVADTIVDGVRYCPATVYDVNDGAEPAGSAVCLIDALVTGVSGSTATLAIDPGDPGYLGAAGSTIAVDFSDLPPTPSAGHRATVCGTVLVGPAFSPTQVTVRLSRGGIASSRPSRDFLDGGLGSRRILLRP